MQVASVPWLLYVGAGSAAIPPLAVLALRRRPRGAAAWILAWCLLLVGQEVAGFAAAVVYRNNLWVGYAVQPAGTALVVWALSAWQARDVARSTLRIALPLALGVWAVLVVAVENTSTFSTAAEPLLSVLTLAAAAWTLVTRSLDEAADGLARQDWFWTCVGLCLYFASLSTLGPLAALLSGDIPLLARAYELKSVVDVVAFILIARGITCQVQPRPSGASSSPASFPSASSSSLSGRR
jgi:hypothetical protein